MTATPSKLAGVPLFRDFQPRELERLERLARPRSFGAGEVIIQEGKLGVAFYVVTSGRVRITQRSGEDEERELRVLGPGGSFGEMGLFSERPRSATVTAVEPAECLALFRLEFLDQLRDHPDLAIKLLDVLSQRLIDAERRLAAVQRLVEAERRHPSGFDAE
jgi:CRP-like cAMP-binding protein